ncbi:DUF1090 family protein [Acinetobacter ihumii]|uniref:DUF1090 family protein n=1 Tax=Acinetobacter ihumii TaxID=2483802 RepID=UPI00102F7016|nr:DUF1090 family protein [Acinetobacter ihumii]
MNTLKKTVVVLATIASLISPCYAASTCAHKKQELQSQLSYAEKYASRYRVAGLKHAIQNVDRYCRDDDSSQIMLQLKTEQKIEKLKTDLAGVERQQDQEKIIKKQRELNQVIYELKQIQINS